MFVTKTEGALEGFFLSNVTSTSILFEIGYPSPHVDFYQAIDVKRVSVRQQLSSCNHACS